MPSSASAASWGSARAIIRCRSSLISYDHVADGYVVTIDRRLLEGGPSWSNNAPDFNQAYADRVSNYYGVAPVDLTLS